MVLIFKSRIYRIKGSNNTESEPHSNKTSIVNGNDNVEVNKILSNEETALSKN
ncbi:MAG: hypothetical protein VW741_01555 [Flammeovirgaceae bacterium]